MKHKEVEFKYNAQEVSLSTFTKFCLAKDDKVVTIIASGWDRFYTNAKDSESFCRHRVGADCNQLTFKRKLVGNNSIVRTEHNLDLTPEMTQDQVSALCAEFGYEYDTAVFKNCFIYKYEWYVLAYYVCYNEEMKELGRFIEIEAREDAGWNNEEEALEEIVLMERLFKAFGISAQSRIKRSLYEMFRTQK